MNKGFPSDKKTGFDQKYQTLQPLGQSKFGMDISSIKGAFPVTITSYVPENTSTDRIINLAGHIAQVGDILIFDGGPLTDQEVTVIGTTANSITISNIEASSILPVDTFRIYRPKTLALTSTGNIVTSSGPVEFVDNASADQVERDSATPANNRPLPTQVYMDMDGVRVPISKNTGTPANTVSLPVEIIGTTGLKLEVNGSNEALVRDADSLAQLVAILAKIIAAPATEAKQDTLITSLALRATEVTSAAILAKIIAAPSTEAKQDLILLDLGLQATESKQDDIIASLSVQATEARQENILDAIGFQATEVTSAAILAKIIAAPATEAKQDDIITALGALDTTPTIFGTVGPILGVTISDPSSTPFEIVASTSAAITRIQSIDDIGEFIELHTGAASSEVLVGYLPVAGGIIDVDIPIGTRLSLRFVTATGVTNTFLFLNLMG